MPVGIRVQDGPRELRAAVLAMKQADTAIRRDISQDMRTTMGPVWKQAVNQHLTGAGRMEAAMLTPGVRIAPGNPPQLVAASSRRRVGNGLIPDRHAPGYEFGASGTTPTRQRTGRGPTPDRTYQRRAMRHLPPRRRNGRVVHPAAAHVLPRIAAYWVQSIIRAFLTAAEGKD